MKYKKVPPHYSLWNKISKTGYSFSETIAEFIDNSIDDMGQKLTIYIEIKKDSIKIRDNASGMNEQQLVDAMTLAKAKKADKKLGMYGLGLKTAAVSLSKHFEILTVKKGSNTCWKTWWDKKDWERKKDWLIPVDDVETPKNIENGGTIIELTNLNVRTSDKITSLRNKIGKRFAPHLKRNVKIYVNGILCKAKERQLIKGSKTDFSVTLSNGEKVWGWVGLLKASSQKHEYGFNTFRYDRMITQNDKIGFSPHSSVARVVGELHLDPIPVTVNKRGWEVTSPLFEEAESLIHDKIKDAVRESRKMSQAVHMKPYEKNKLERLKEGIKHALQAPDLREFRTPKVTGNKLNGNNGGSTKTGTTDDEVEKRNRTDPPQNPGTNLPTGDGNKRKPKVTHIAKRTRIYIHGKEFNYKHSWQTLGKNGPMYSVDFDKEKNHLEIHTNTDFPALKLTNDRVYYSFSHIVDAIVDVMIDLTETSADKKDYIKETIMRESSKYIIKQGK